MAMLRKKPTLEPRINRFDQLSDGIAFTILDRLNNSPFDRKSFSLVSRTCCALESRHRTFLRPRRVEFLGKILCRYPNVSTLDLSLCRRVSDSSINEICRFCKDKLRSINLARSKSFTQVGISNLVKNSGNLIELDLSNADELEDSAIAVIAELKNLERLWLSRCRMITDVGVGFIAKGCGKLKLLSLNGCYNVGDEGVVLVALNCKQLRHLDISHLMISNECLSQIFLELQHLQDLFLVGCYGLNDDGIAAITGGKSLEKLDMTWCEEVSHLVLSSITTAAANLRQIILSHSPLIDGAFVGSLQKLSSLESIKLDGSDVTTLGLEAIGDTFLSLMELSLNRCTGVTDQGLSYLLKKHKHLRKLDISCCRNITAKSIACLTETCTSLVSLKMTSCWLVSHEAFFMIGLRCPFLEELDLTNTEITDEGLKSISRCSRLKILKLGLCYRITDWGLSHIGKNCSMVKLLELCGWDGVADRSISATGLGCPELEMVDISYCTSITDCSLISLSRCSKLKTLEVQGCPLISSTGLATVARRCKQLLWLNIEYCRNIDDSAMIRLAQFCRNLKQINLSYTSVTDVGLLSLASIGSLQTIIIIHVSGLTPNGLATALLACAGLAEVELAALFGSSIPKSLLKHIEARGSTVTWNYKLQPESDPK